MRLHLQRKGSIDLRDKFGLPATKFAGTAHKVVVVPAMEDDKTPLRGAQRGGALNLVQGRAGSPLAHRPVKTVLSSCQSVYWTGL